MSEVDDKTVEAIEKEIKNKEEESSKDFDTKVNAEVETRLKQMEEDKKKAEEAKKIEDEKKSKEEKLEKELEELRGKNADLEKELENTPKRKSIPAQPQEPAETPKEYKDLSKAEKVKLNKDYARSILNMDI